MNWVNGLSRSVIALALIFLVAGCAAKVDQQEEALVTREQARQDALQQDFREAVTTMEAGNNDSAREQFEALHREAPSRTGPLANLGILAQADGDHAAAKARFGEVIALDPGHAVALNHLGVIAREEGEFEQAEAFYRDALNANSDFLPAVMNLAILLDIYLGRPAEALPLYEQYQSTVEEPNPRLKDWIFDVKNRM